MRRRQLFEFNDQPWLPGFAREALIESLGRGIRWGRYFDQVAPAFRQFLQDAGSDRILDLCSGAGEPVSILLDALRSHGHALPDVVMCDLFPNAAALSQVAARYPGRVSWLPEPVDATRVPPHLSRPIRTYINCMHHFPPHLVRRILEDCVRARSAVFVLESFPRDLLAALAQAPSLTASALASPLLSPRPSLGKTIFTYSGLIFALGAFDWFASVCRVHLPDELERIACSIPSASYRWSHGTAPYPLGGLALWFAGIPA